MSIKRYLVTGGSGFIGSALVHRLVRNGHYVRVLDNHLRGVPSRLEDISQNITLVEADIRDASAVRGACKNIDSVCHLAYLNGTEFFYTKPELVLDIGVKGIVNVIDACINEKVKELIVASSSEVYQNPPAVPTPEEVPMTVPDPLNPRYSYVTGKILSEVMAVNYGRKYFERVIIFRPHNVYGPDMGWEHVIPQFVLRMKKICKETGDKKIKFPIQGTGKETRAFVFIEDFIEGLMLAIKKGKHLGIYNIGTTEEVTIEDLARQVGKFFKREIDIVPGKLLTGSPLRRCPDISKVQALGYNPGYSLTKGLSLTCQWYDQNADKAPQKEEV